MKKHQTESSEKIILNAEPRKIFGKKLKKLRKQGIIPANVYGPDIKSEAISVNFKDFIKVYKKVKETGLVYLQLKNESIPVLIKNVQKHPINGAILHVDFRKVDLKQKIETEVPVVIVGESPAVAEKKGVLLTQVNTLTIFALPEEIPSEIKIDISNLKEIGDEIKVSDLTKTSPYEIKTPINKVIVSVVAHKEESTTTKTVPSITEEKKIEEKTQADSSSSNNEMKKEETK